MNELLKWRSHIIVITYEKQSVSDFDSPVITLDMIKGRITAFSIRMYSSPGIPAVKEEKLD